MGRLPPFAPRRWRRRAAAAVVVAAVLTPVGASPARAQPADELADDVAAKREQAARIADEVDELGTTASIALEQYRQGQSRLEAADAALFETRRRADEIRTRYETTRAIADERILAMYRGEDTPDPVSLLDARNAQELGSRQHYASVLAAHDRSTMRDLQTHGDELAEVELRLRTQREDVAAETEALRVEQADVETTMAERQAALDAAQGELADLVAEEQRRRQAEEEARARRAAEERARRQAEDDARRRAATPTTSSSPTTTVLGSAGAAPTTPAVTPPAVDPGPAPGVHPRAGEAVQAALDKLGTPYRWGANGPDAYDCSGLTTYAWGLVGVRLPRSSGLQKQALPPVSPEALAPGDLVFFGNPVHHVGIYIGDGKMVNAPFTGTEVRVDSIYRRDYAGAGRPG